MERKARCGCWCTSKSDGSGGFWYSWTMGHSSCFDCESLSNTVLYCLMTKHSRLTCYENRLKWQRLTKGHYMSLYHIYAGYSTPCVYKYYITETTARLGWQYLYRICCSHTWISGCGIWMEAIRRLINTLLKAGTRSSIELGKSERGKVCVYVSQYKQFERRHSLSIVWVNFL